MNKTPKFDSFIFDLDGTLWNTAEVSSKAYNAAIQKDGRSSLEVTPAIIKQEFGKPLPQIAADLFPELPKNEQLELMEAMTLSNDIFIKNAVDDVLFPKTRETLKTLAKTAPLFIVSNCLDGYPEIFFAKSGLKHLFKECAYLYHPKDNKGSNIKYIVEKYSLRNAVYIGDTLGDYEATIAAGEAFIFAEYGYGNAPKAKIRINDICELINFI